MSYTNTREKFRNYWLLLSSKADGKQGSWEGCGGGGSGAVAQGRPSVETIKRFEAALGIGWSQRHTRHAATPNHRTILPIPPSLDRHDKVKSGTRASSFDFALNDRSCPNVVRPVDLTFLEDYSVGDPEERIPPLGHGEGRSDEQYEEALLDT